MLMALGFVEANLHSVSGIGIKIGTQMKPHVGKGAFAQESKFL